MSDRAFKRVSGLIVPQSEFGGSVKATPRQFELRTGYDWPRNPQASLAGSTHESRHEDVNVSATITATIRDEMARGFQSYLGPHDERVTRMEAAVASLAESVHETNSNVATLTRDVDRVVSQMETLTKTTDERLSSLWRSVDELSGTVKEQSSQIRSLERGTDKLLGGLRAVMWIAALVVPLVVVQLARAIF